MRLTILCVRLTCQINSQMGLGTDGATETVARVRLDLFAGDTLGHLARWYRIRPRFGHGLLRAFAELGLGEQSEDAVEGRKARLEKRDANFKGR